MGFKKGFIILQYVLIKYGRMDVVESLECLNNSFSLTSISNFIYSLESETPSLTSALVQKYIPCKVFGSPGTKLCLLAREEKLLILISVEMRYALSGYRKYVIRILKLKNKSLIPQRSYSCAETTGSWRWDYA